MGGKKHFNTIIHVRAFMVFKKIMNIQTWYRRTIQVCYNEHIIWGKYIKMSLVNTGEIKCGQYISPLNKSEWK